MTDAAAAAATTGTLYGDHVHPIKRTINDSGIEMVCDTHRSQLIGCGVDIADVSGFNVLECGGTGRDALGWARLGAKHVTHIDLSASNVGRIKSYCESAGIDNVTAINGNILDYDLPQQSFDIVRSRGVWHHLEYPARGLARYASWCKVGGLVHLNAYRAGTFYYYGVTLLRELADLVPIEVIEKVMSEAGVTPTRAGCLLDDFYVPFMHALTHQRVADDFAKVGLSVIWPENRQWDEVNHDIRYPDMPEKLEHIQYWMRKEQHVDPRPELISSLAYQSAEDERQLAENVPGADMSQSTFAEFSEAARRCTDTELVAHELIKIYLCHHYDISVLPMSALERHKRLSEEFKRATKQVSQ